MSKLIFAVGAIVSLSYVAYFFFAVRWRFQHERKDREKRRAAAE
jgi:hypothetical protein